MADLLFAFSCILPLFLMIAVGAVCGKTGVLPEKGSLLLNKVCFTVLAPCMMVNSVLKADFASIESPLLYVYGALSIVIAVLLLSWIAPKFIKDKPKLAAFVHGSFRANTMLLGAPLALNLFGETGAFPILLLLTVSVPVFNVAGILALQFFGPGEGPLNLKKGIKDLLLNPILLGTAAGFLLKLTGVSLPAFATSVLSGFSSAFTPMAMLCLGARFRLKKLSENKKLVCWGALIKLVLLPALFTLPLLLCGAPGMSAVAVFFLHGTPTASTSGILSEAMGADGELANEMILVSTLLSVFTLFIAILLIRRAGLL